VCLPEADFFTVMAAIAGYPCWQDRVAAGKEDRWCAVELEDVGFVFYRRCHKRRSNRIKRFLTRRGHCFNHTLLRKKKRGWEKVVRLFSEGDTGTRLFFKPSLRFKALFRSRMMQASHADTAKLGLDAQMTMAPRVRVQLASEGRFPFPVSTSVKESSLFLHIIYLFFFFFFG